MTGGSEVEVCVFSSVVVDVDTGVDVDVIVAGEFGCVGVGGWSNDGVV